MPGLPCTTIIALHWSWRGGHHSKCGRLRTRDTYRIREVLFLISMCGIRAANHLKISISIRYLSEQSVFDSERWVRTDVTRGGLDAVALLLELSHRGTFIFIYKLPLRINGREWRKLYGDVREQVEPERRPNDMVSRACSPTAVSDGECKCCFTLMVANTWGTDVSVHASNHTGCCS